MAFVELQVNTAESPVPTVLALAVSVTVGTRVTDTVAAALVPPGPVQVSEKLVFAVSAPVLDVPLVDWVPLQPPDAVHDVAFVELHVNVDAAPLLTVVWDALSATVGGGTTAGGLSPPPHAAISSMAPRVG